MSNKLNTKLIKKEEIAKDTLAITLEKPSDFNYSAGQSIDLTLPASDGSNLTHTFSLITAPHEDNIAIATRVRDSQYKQTLKDLGEDSILSIEGPYGEFALHQDVEKLAVFIVGGIGITPFLSLLRDAKNNKSPHKFYLFYSNRRPEDTTFLQELNDLDNSTDIDFTFIPTMTEFEATAKGWSGEQGYITWELISRYIPAGVDVHYYMAGPQGMTTAMHKMLSENGVSEESMTSEQFSGY